MTLPPSRPAGRATLVLGGVASGKSAHAESLLAAEPAVTYVATGRPPSGLDPEWDAKVYAHRARRPPSWHSAEVPDPADLPAVLSSASGCLLWDSVGSWLTAALDAAGAWDGAPGWQTRLAAAADGVVKAWTASGARRVAVAEEVGWGVVPATASGRLFQHELGRLNQRMADGSDEVVLVVAGRPLDLTKGLP